MKKLLALTILAATLAAGTALKAQEYPDEYLGLPGDNLNLYAVMKLFQESKTLEEFEKNLNDQNSRINNLDLNGDNLVDYLMVMDNVDGDVHNIVLRVAINQRESQDVAVIVVERLSNGQAIVQMIGDEDLYGKNYIIEPIFDNEITGQTPNPGYTGNNTVVYGRNITVVRTTPVIIASWPLIRFIYRPDYVVWRSGWYWGYYPTYWSPWQPYYWHYYYGYHYNWYNDYYGHYRRWYTPRYTHWNDYYYTSIRIYSPVVRVRIQAGNYRNTYSRPETRKDGEAVYQRTYTEQSRRSTPVTSTNSTVRRTSGSTSSQVRNTSVSGSSASRRTVTSTETRQATNRPANTVATRPSTSSSTTQRSVSTTTRPTNTVATRPSTSRTTTQRSVSTTTRPTNTVTARPSSGSNSTQRSVSTTSRPSNTASARPSSSRTTTQRSVSTSSRPSSSVSSSRATRTTTARPASSPSRSSSSKASSSSNSSSKNSQSSSSGRRK